MEANIQPSSKKNSSSASWATDPKLMILRRYGK